MIKMAQIPDQTAESSPLAVVPTPSPEALLREQLATTEAERDKLKAENGKLSGELKQYDEALVDLRTKLKAFEENPFSLAIANLDAGQVLQDAGDLLKSLAGTVMRRQEKGVFSLKISIKPYQATSLTFTPELKITEPKPESVKGLFFCDEEGNISRKDPNQKEFTFGRSRDDERFDDRLR